MGDTRIAVVAVLVLSVIILSGYSFLNKDDANPWDEHMEKQRREYELAAAPHVEAIEEAHSLWAAERTSEAVAQYKLILKQDGRSCLDDELGVAYRRVIEFEAEYGDPGEARDWCLRARSEWNLKISFSSETARRIWNEVALDTDKQPERLWQRVLNR